MCVCMQIHRYVCLRAARTKDQQKSEENNESKEKFCIFIVSSTFSRVLFLFVFLIFGTIVFISFMPTCIRTHIRKIYFFFLKLCVFFLPVFLFWSFESEKERMDMFVKSGFSIW